MVSEMPQAFLDIPKDIEASRFPFNTLTKRGQENWAQSIQRVIIESWLEGNCLTLNDRLSMRYSIECRSPFLDADLTDYALSLQTDNETLESSKKQLKLALVDLLSDNVLSAPKSGFTPPVNLWKKIICENFQSEYHKCLPLKEFIKFDTINKRNYDLMYKLIILSSVINQITTG